MIRVKTIATILIYTVHLISIQFVENVNICNTFPVHKFNIKFDSLDRDFFFIYFTNSYIYIYIIQFSVFSQYNAFGVKKIFNKLVN